MTEYNLWNDKKSGIPIAFHLTPVKTAYAKALGRMIYKLSAIFLLICPSKYVAMTPLFFDTKSYI